MSCVVVVTLLIIANWPVITAAVTAAVGSVGFSIVQGAGSGVAVRTTTRTEIEVEESEILGPAAGSAEELVVEKDGIRATFSRDARGALKLCMEGESVSKAELKRVGEDLIGRVTQQYAYHRIVTELKERGMAIVDEQVEADRTVKIRVRNV